MSVNVRGNGLRWADLAPKMMNHGFSGDPINDDKRAFPTIEIDRNADNVQTEEALTIQGNGITDDNLDTNVAQREPGWATMETDLDFAQFKQPDEVAGRILVTTVNDGALKDQLVKTNPRDPSFDAAAEEFGVMASRVMGQDVDLDKSSIPYTDRNPFSMRKPQQPTAAAQAGSAAGPVITAMEQATKSSKHDYYFESAKKPFSKQDESDMDHRDKLGLRSKNIVKNKGNELAQAHQKDLFDKALDKAVETSQFIDADVRERDDILGVRGAMSKEKQEKQIEQLRVPGATLTASIPGLVQLSAQNYKRYKSQKLKHEQLQTAMM